MNEIQNMIRRLAWYGAPFKREATLARYDIFCGAAVY